MRGGNGPAEESVRKTPHDGRLEAGRNSILPATRILFMSRQNAAKGRPTVEVQHPDEFLYKHLNLAQGLFCSAVKKVRLRLKHPPYDVSEYLDTLTAQGLVATVSELRQFANLL